MHRRPVMPRSNLMVSCLNKNRKRRTHNILEATDHKGLLATKTPALQTYNWCESQQAVDQHQRGPHIKIAAARIFMACGALMKQIIIADITTNLAISQFWIHKRVGLQDSAKGTNTVFCLITSIFWQASMQIFLDIFGTGTCSSFMFF